MRGYTLDTYGAARTPVLFIDIDKISENIRLALLTPKGTRPNLPKFGSRLHLLQFDPLDQGTLDMCHFCIQEAIRDSIDDIIVDSIEYKVSHYHRSLKISVVFRDISSGLSGRSNVVFANGEFN